MEGVFQLFLCYRINLIENLKIIVYINFLMKILSGTSNPKLSKDICRQLKLKLINLI